MRSLFKEGINGSQQERSLALPGRYLGCAHGRSREEDVPDPTVGKLSPRGVNRCLVILLLKRCLLP